MQNSIVVRVYGICINKNNEVLLSDEFQMGMKMTKFPGGGLEIGEGTIDCLKREAIEEFGQEIEVLNHLYTTDFYQKAMFYENCQLISIYYQFKFKEAMKFKISSKAFDFKENINGSQSFRWKSINEIAQEDLTFPIDKIMVDKIKTKVGYID